MKYGKHDFTGAVLEYWYTVHLIPISDDIQCTIVIVKNHFMSLHFAREIEALLVYGHNQVDDHSQFHNAINTGTLLHLYYFRCKWADSGAVIHTCSAFAFSQTKISYSMENSGALSFTSKTLIYTGTRLLSLGLPVIKDKRTGYSGCWKAKLCRDQKAAVKCLIFGNCIFFFVSVSLWIWQSKA